MKVWPLKDDRGELIGFEIPHRFISSGRIAHFFARLPGVRVTAKRRMFERGNNVHVRFEFSGTPFVVEEPFGDNSRLSVLPDEGHRPDQLSINALMALIAGGGRVAPSCT